MRCDLPFFLPLPPPHRLVGYICKLAAINFCPFAIKHLKRFVQSKRKKLKKKRQQNVAQKRSVLTIFIRFFPPDAMLVLCNQRFSHHFHTQLGRVRERGREAERELRKCLITSWAIRTQFEQISQNENAWENGQVNTCVAHTYTNTHS